MTIMHRTALLAQNLRDQNVEHPDAKDWQKLIDEFNEGEHIQSKTGEFYSKSK